MLKKILLAAAMLASASFAAWDYFPVLQSGKGSVKGGLYYDWDDDWSQAGLKVGARFTVAPNFELSLQSWGYQFWGEWDCSGCENGGDGFRDLILGGRYQITPQVNAFLDVKLPIGTDDSDGTPPGNNEFYLYLGGQFSRALPSGLSFGAEGAFLWGFQKHKEERGLDLHLGGEVDFSIPKTKLTPFIGLKFIARLTESTYEIGKKEYGYDDDGSHEIMLWLGTKFMLSPQLKLDAHFIFRSQDLEEDDPIGHPLPGKFYLGGDAAGLYVGCEFFF